MLQAAPFICGTTIVANLLAGIPVALDLAAPLGKAPTGLIVISGQAPCVAAITGLAHGGLYSVTGTATGTFTIWVY